MCSMEPPKLYPICDPYNYALKFSKIPRKVGTDLTKLVYAVSYWFDRRDLYCPTRDCNKRICNYICAHCETFKLSFLELEHPDIVKEDKEETDKEVTNNENDKETIPTFFHLINIGQDSNIHVIRFFLWIYLIIQNQS